MTPAVKELLNRAVTTATTNTPRVNNALLRAAHKEHSDAARREQLQQAKVKAMEIVVAIQMAELALVRGERREDQS